MFKAGRRNPIVRGRTHTFRGARGYALMVAVLLMPVLFLLAGTILSKALIDLGFTGKDVGDKQALLIAESGESIAMYMLAAGNYRSFTHDPSGNSPINEVDRLPIAPMTSGFAVTVDEEGWYTWRWNPGDTTLNMSGTGAAERFRFKTWNPDGQGTDWQMIIEGYYGENYKKVIRTGGTIDLAYSYAYLANDSLSDFNRSQDQTVTGKIHANNSLYFRPTNSTLKIESDAITAGSSIITGNDAWGRGSGGGTVQIRKGAADSADFAPLAFSSTDPRWLDPSAGALAVWKGKMLDGSLGAGRVYMPPMEALEPGGYYEQHASIVIDENVLEDPIHGVRRITAFRNRALNPDQAEQLVEIDLSKFKGFATYKEIPITGGGGVLLYCKVPVVFVNGSTLPAKMTVVSNSNIYIRGDFNKFFADRNRRDTFVRAVIDADTHGRDPGTVNPADYATKKPAALITSQRIWLLSQAFDYNAVTRREARDPESFTFNEASVSRGNAYTGRFNSLSAAAKALIRLGEERDDELEVNAATADGAPLVSEVNWLKPANWNGRQPTDEEKAGTSCCANNDTFLETWGPSKTVKRRGSVIHLQHALMAESFRNTESGPGRCGWLRYGFYTPPERRYFHDETLAGENTRPPCSLYAVRRTFWRAGSE